MINMRSKQSIQLWTALIFRIFENIKFKKRNRGRYRATCLEQDEFGLGPCLLELSCVRVSLSAQFLLIAFGPLWVLVTHFQAHCQASSQGNPVVSSFTTPGKNAENKLLFLFLSLQKEIPFFLPLSNFGRKKRNITNITLTRWVEFSASFSDIISTWFKIIWIVFKISSNFPLS